MLPVVPSGSLLSALVALVMSTGLVVVPHLSLVTTLLRVLLLALMSSVGLVAMTTLPSNSRRSIRAMLESILRLVWLVWLSVDLEALSLNTRLVCLTII
jgi:hypothetical protein